MRHAECHVKAVERYPELAAAHVSQREALRQALEVARVLEGLPAGEGSGGGRDRRAWGRLGGVAPLRVMQHRGILTLRHSAAMCGAPAGDAATVKCLTG